MDPFERAVLAGMKRAGVAPGTPVAVGFSGGADSTALLAALAAVRRFPLTAIHVNHGLRGRESDRDEAAARATARRLGVECRAVKAPVRRAPGESLEDAARKAREREFAAARTVATAHTRDDQAETVLYRAARGAGTRGLRGILPSRGLGAGARLVRPLLDVARAEVRAYLRRRRLPFVTDSSNADPRFARNVIRRDVLPALETARPGAARHLAELAREATGLTELVEAWADRVHAAALDGDSLQVRVLQDAPPPVRHAVVARLLPHGHRLTRAHRNALDRLFGEPPLRIAPLGGGWIANRRGPVLRVVGPPREPDAPAPLPVPGETVLSPSCRRLAARVEAGSRGFLAAFRRDKTAAEEALDASRVKSPLTVGPPRAGERMRPLGAPGSRKIADILADLGVPRTRRREELVVRDAGGAVVWLVGRRIADHARITPRTRLVLRLSYL